MLRLGLKVRVCDERSFLQSRVFISFAAPFPKSKIASAYMNARPVTRESSVALDSLVRWRRDFLVW